MEDTINHEHDGFLACRLTDCIFRVWSVFFCWEGMEAMETRIAVIGIIVEDMASVPKLNALLHDYSQYVIGRMGLPYQKRGVHIISVAIDAPQDAISALSGGIGRLNGISVKTAYSNVVSQS